MDLSKIAPAIVAAQAELGGVVKDSKNPHFKSRYASLEAVITEAKPILARHKLAFLQMPGELTEMGLSVTTMLLHESGQSISSTVTVPLQKRDPQGVGSTITYACRYSLMAMLGMPSVDDVAESGMMRQDVAPPPPMPAPKPNAADLVNWKCPEGVNPDLWETAMARVQAGVEAYQEFWTKDLTRDEKQSLIKHHGQLKAIAERKGVLAA